MENTLNQLASEVETLSLLLKVVLGLLVVLLFVGIRFLRGIAEAQRLLIAAGRTRAFRDEAEHLLKNESYEELESLSDRRLHETPGDPAAFYFLGRSQFGLKRLAEAKANFKRAWDLDPLSRDGLEKFIIAVEEELAENRPKAVD